MIRIALRSLAHDRGKLATSVAGVAFAATLVLSQIGLYAGFLKTSSALITRAGGDVWVMAKGTEVLDNGELMAAGSRGLVAAHDCVEHVRALLMRFAVIRKPNGTLDSVQVIGFEPNIGPVLPWGAQRGLPQDLHGPARIGVDENDLKKLGIYGEPLGSQVSINEQTASIAMLTQGVRSFTLLPNVFAEIDNARRLTNTAVDQANYWIVDVKNQNCKTDLISYVNTLPDLEARTTDSFRKLTQTYWVEGSGAGSALAFSALLGLVVGTVIVGQTLYSITKEHLRELGTLKAIGARTSELLGFVAWQAAFLAIVGGGTGMLMASLVQKSVENIGLEVVLSSEVLLIGASAILLMCVLASIGSVRKVIALEAAEVFK